MRTHTSGFTNALKTFGREINATVTYQSTTTSYILTTESGDNIITEDEYDLGTERGPVVFDNTSLNRVTPLFKTDLFKTIMKGVELDCNSTLPKGTWINVQFGVKVSGTYEYIDYGNYLIYKEPQYNADTKSYVCTVYDKMIESMIKYDDDPLIVTYPITYENMLIAICDKLGWDYDLTGLVNASVEITEDRYSENNMTYRDILDDLCPASMGNFMFDVDDTFIVKYPTETSETITDENLRDVNVTLGKKYGPVNSLNIKTADDVVLNYEKDETSITNDGLTEINIKDNILLNSIDGTNFITDMFTKLNGLEYYLYDISTTGLCVFEPLDRFTINHDSVNYSVLMLNDTTNITQGLKEDCYVDEPIETTQEYETSTPTQEQTKKAIKRININANELFLKVDNDGNVVSCFLGQKTNKGSLFSVKADNIDFESYSFDLATNDISIISDNVDITNDGIKLKNGATIVGGDGVLSNIQSATFGRFANYDFLGFEEILTSSGNEWQNRDLSLDVYIPSDFTITEAKITLFHTPADWWYFDGSYIEQWGYSRNIKLYSSTATQNYKFVMGYYSEYQLQLADLNLTEVSNAFGSSGYTATNTSGSTLQVTTSIDIKNSLSSGNNKLVLRSAVSSPTSTADGLSKTGMARAVINVLGYKG
jgi:hypothetical protein